MQNFQLKTEYGVLRVRFLSTVQALGRAFRRGQSVPEMVGMDVHAFFTPGTRARSLGTITLAKQHTDLVTVTELVCHECVHAAIDHERRKLKQPWDSAVLADAATEEQVATIAGTLAGLVLGKLSRDVACQK